MSALTSGYDDVTSFSAILAAILEVGVVLQLNGSQDVFCQVYICWILKVSFWNYNTPCANVKRGSCRSYSWSWGVPGPSPTQNESYVIMWYADGKTHCNHQTFRWVLPMKLMRDLILTQSTSIYSKISSVCYIRSCSCWAASTVTDFQMAVHYHVYVFIKTRWTAPI